jgi:YesN/AraC family two-component response regulator
MNFSKNIQKLKMNKAAKLLLNEDISIQNISDLMGYSDPNNFRQIFKKYYNMSPNDFRNIKNKKHFPSF